MQNLKNLNTKILVSHSGRQYVHQLLRALQLNKIPFRFFTSFAFKPEAFPFLLLKFLPRSFGKSLEKEFKKRSFYPIEDRDISYFPYFELLREVTDKIFKNRLTESMLFFRDRIHDAWAASKVSEEYSMVIGYEECSLRTFRAAKRRGLTTILDLAQIHYKEIEVISNKFPVFSEIYKNRSLRQKINAIKEEELQLADYIICLSEFAKESLVKNGYPAQHIFVVSLGFDPGKFSPKSQYNETGRLKIVYAGTITKRKGIDLLLRLKDDLKEYIEITFIGPMADAAELFEKSKDKFTWFPYLEHSQMNEVLKSADIFVFPSYLDSWAMVVIEAMACGLPVIISDNTGAKDGVDQGNGFVIPSGNYDALKERVMFFLKNRDAVETMGRLARMKAEKYTWQAYYNQIENILQEIQSIKN